MYSQNRQKSVLPCAPSFLYAKVLLRTATLSGLLFVSVNAFAQDQVPTKNVVPLPDQTMGTVDIEVLVVDELTPRRVPFTAFRIVSLERPQETHDVRTGEGGHIELQLPPGKYKFQSVTPLKFKGKTYDWEKEFDVSANEKTPLHLTGDDAITHDDVPQTARVVADEANIYRALRDGVATVESESGSGTGFLIDKRGLLLTNHHVVEGSRRLIVRFHPGLRVEATVVATDTQNDIAVVQVNSEVCANLPIIPLARPKPEHPGETAPAIAVEGEKVLAIGSPLGEEKILTTGLVSRVKEGILISNVNINPGNSGGPLVNMAGEAIGITTFNEGAASGPGLSGIVTLDRAFATLDPIVARLDQVQTDKEKVDLPSARLLPDFSEVAVPGDALDTAARSEIQIPLLNEPSAFQTRFLTPFNLASLQFKEERELEKKQAKRRGKGGKDSQGEVPLHTRTRFYDATHAAVYISVTPKLVESKGSKRRGMLGGMLGAMTGTFIRTKKDMEFRHDFYDMELLRNGVTVEPLERKRVPLSVYYENLFLDFEAKDTATAGVYAFDPSAFAPGAPLVLRVWREYNTKKPDEIKISDALRASMYEQFSSHRQAIQSVAAQTTTQTLALSPSVTP